MNVLVTGANGFLGSHVLDTLLSAPGFEVSILLRQTSDTRFISKHLQGQVTVHHGSLSDADALERAVAGVDAVVHCAAKTKALHEGEFAAVNRDGTQRLIRAVRARSVTLRHFVLVSSLAVSGPGTPETPVRETDPPNPLTAYGRSKRDAEAAVERLDDIPWTILRPAAIYGPRDRDFLPLFRAVQRGIAPLPFGGRQTLSLVYGADVAAAVKHCLGKKEAAGKTYHVAAGPPVSVAELVRAIAVAMTKQVRTVPVPGPVLYVACVLQEWASRVRGKAHILSRQKWPELVAPGWVCTTERIRDELGFSAATSLTDGLASTVAWCRQEGWM